MLQIRKINAIFALTLKNFHTFAKILETMNLTKAIMWGTLSIPMLSQAARQQKPNVLIVISDDHSVPFVGCYDNRDVQTPHLDKFAKEGMIFWRGYVTCPQSAPSRASILTGRSPIITMTSRFGAPLDRSIITYPEYLIKEAGYYAGLCGRTHHQDGKPGVTGSFTDKYYHERKLSTMESRMQYVKTASGDAEGGQGKMIEQFYEFMEVRDKSKPFYLQFCFTDPHRPYTAPKVHDPNTLTLPYHYPDTQGVREDLAAYYDEVHRADRTFGEAMEYLEKNGLKEHTLVIFLGDNGAAQFRGKGTLYELGINVPLLIRWPGVVKPGGVCREVISMEDLGPTVMEAAGLQPKPDMTGISFLPMLEGNPAPTRQYAFAERGPHADGIPSDVNNAFDQARVIVSKDYKLIYNCQPTLKQAPVDFSHAPFYQELIAMNEKGQLEEKFVNFYFWETPRPLLEFYDLKNDPSETNNVATDKAYFDAKEEMLKELILWMIQERDYLPLPIKLVESEKVESKKVNVKKQVK